MSLAELAKLVNISRQTLQIWVKSGILNSSSTTGKRNRYLYTDFLNAETAIHNKKLSKSKQRKDNCHPKALEIDEIFASIL